MYEVLNVYNLLESKLLFEFLYNYYIGYISVRITQITQMTPTSQMVGHAGNLKLQ